MGVPRDASPFGSQTVTGPGWPNVEEEQLEQAAMQYEQWAAKMTGSVVPEQQGQLVSMQGGWTGPSSVAAAGEATTIIGSHQANAALATTIAARLHAMAATVMETKAAVNAAAEEVQQECMAMQAMPVQNKDQLIQSRIKMGLAQNMTTVSANAATVTANAAVPPNLSSMAGKPPGSGEAMQMMMQMAQMAAQLPSQLAGMVTQAPQQLMQPLQSLTSMFGGGGAGKGASGAGPSPFSAFSNHPLAGGSGAGGGAGLVKAASTPGAGGHPSQTPAMAKLAGTSVEPVSMGAGTGAVGGVAPVNSGGGMGGGGMMGQRGSGGAGSTAALATPAPLDYGSEEEPDDDW